MTIVTILHIAIDLYSSSALLVRTRGLGGTTKLIASPKRKVSRKVHFQCVCLTKRRLGPIKKRTGFLLKSEFRIRGIDHAYSK